MDPRGAVVHLFLPLAGFQAAIQSQKLNYIWLFFFGNLGVSRSVFVAETSTIHLVGFFCGNLGGSRSVLWDRFVHGFLLLAGFQAANRSPNLVRNIN